jgi:hypothetical protein
MFITTIHSVFSAMLAVVGESTAIVSSTAVITKVTYLLFLFLILALFVERSTEIFMSVVKYIDLKKDWYTFWNAQAEKYKIRMDRLFDYQGSDTEDKKLLFRWILWSIISESPNVGGKDIIAAKTIRTQYYRIISRVFALLLSVFFSIWMYTYLEVDLISILNRVSEEELIAYLPDWVKIILTAGILTAGSEPLHQLILRFERVGQSKKTKV